MDIKNRNEYLLLPGFRDHPLVVLSTIPGFAPPYVPDGFLAELFGKKPKGLKTWPKAGDKAHWLAVRNGINLHTDPNYSRYAYQLVVRNDGWKMAGLNPEKLTSIPPGTVYIMDTHSPHQLVKSDNNIGRFFVGVGFDSKEVLPVEEAAARLLEYCNRTAVSLL
jgi:hypothetical protein